MLIVLIILAVIFFGGIGHTGYSRGWYGNGGYYDGAPPAHTWGGGGLGLIALLVLLWLLFAHTGHPGYYH